eukprot:07630.XXX_440917_441021_1 [CDS] Oithona nana genome sequencing.
MSSIFKTPSCNSAKPLLASNMALNTSLLVAKMNL